MEDNSSTISWSTFVQRPETLYKTRASRFRDQNRQSILEAMGLEDGMDVLEIGCGPGAFCHALERWLPNSRMTGLDRDSVFIAYATQRSKEIGSKCRFVVGDATRLDFPDRSFAATTSHTVVEHVETTAFLREQYRVLRPGGVSSVLSVRTSIGTYREPWETDSGEQKALWDRMEPYFKASDQKYGVAKHPINETELAKRMTETWS